MQLGGIAFVELQEEDNNSEIYFKWAWQMGTLDLVYVRQRPKNLKL